MKKIVPGVAIAILFAFAACKKTNTIQQKESETSPLPQKEFICGAKEDHSRAASSQRITGTPSTPIVLLLDFNGQQVVNSAWMNPGTISCPAVPSSLLTAAMKDYIVASVAEDFSAFFVKVTKNETDYNAAPVNRRMRCVITHNMANQFGYVGGISIIGSLLWADNTPNFVFCDVLEYNQKYIAGAVSHELGHTFGLHHQSRYSPDCAMEEEFHSGAGWDALGWAPIMGLSYYQNMVTWHNGPNNLGCAQIQNDMSVIAGIAGTKADDYNASLNTSTVQLPYSGTKNGILESAADKDAFLKNETSSRRIKLTSHGNSDLVLEVYNSNGQLATTYDDTNGPNVNVVVSGKKYLKVRISSNQPFVPAGDGFGGYTLSVSNP